MKRHVFTLFAAALVWLCAGTAAAVDNPFWDVSEGAEYYDAVLWAYACDVTSGTSADTFSPRATCSRGQVVTFLWRAYGRPEPQTTQNPFTDVREDSYCYKAVLWAVENGITNGTGPNTFAPSNPCTFAHVVTFLWRAAGQPRDVSNALSGDNWYSPAVTWANENGLLAGFSFHPSAPCPRACIVTYLYRGQMGISVSVEDMLHDLMKSYVLGESLYGAIEDGWDEEWIFLYFEGESDEATSMSEIADAQILETSLTGAVAEGWADDWLTFYYHAFTDALADTDSLSGAWLDEGIDDDSNTHVSSLYVLQRGNVCAFRAYYRGGYRWLFAGILENNAVRYTDGILTHREEIEETGLTGEVRVEGKSLLWDDGDGQIIRYYRTA